MSPGLEERDGDSISVQFDLLKTSGGTGTIPYLGLGVSNAPPINPFPNSFMVPGTGGALLDVATGTVTFVPAIRFGAYVSFRSDELREVNGVWVRVGYIQRNIVIRTTTGNGRIINEPNPTPQISTPKGGFWGPVGNSSAPLNFNEYRVTAPVCKTTCFTISTRDIPGPSGGIQSVGMASSLGLLADSLGFTETTNNMLGYQSKTFCVTPQAQTLRRAPYRLHVFARDSWPISGIASVSVPIYVVPGSDVEVGSDQVSCNNAPLQFSASNIPPGSTVSWSPAAFLNNPTTSAPTLNTGVQACTARIDVQVPVVSPISATVIAVQQPSCLQPLGVVRLQIAGGSPPYLVNGIATTNTLQLAPGTYVLTVTDSRGCTFVIGGNVVIQPVSALSATVSVRAVTCNGFNDGQILLSNLSGKPPYSIIVNGQTAQADTIISNLAPGAYTIAISDSNNCSITLPSVTITQPSPISFNVVPTSPSGTCNSTNGLINVLAPTGGVAPYQYSLDGAIFQSSATFLGLASGRQVVYVRDNVGCQSTIITTLINPSGIQVNQVNASSTVTCFGGSNGFINLSNIVPSGGTYNYTLNNGSTTTSGSFGGLAAGHYRVLVTDTVSGCSFSTNVRIASPRQITATLTRRTNPTCFGVSNGMYVVSAGGGTGTLAYAINNGAFVASPVFSNRPAGNDSIRVRDVSGCQVALGTSLTSPNFLTVSVTSQSSPTCHGLSNGTVQLTAVGGTPPYRFTRAGSPAQDVPLFSNLLPGVNSYIATDARGCTSPAVNVNLTQPSQIIPTISTLLASNCSTSNGSITLQSTTGGIAPYSYSLNGSTFQSSNTFGSLPFGRYNLFVRDGTGCEVTQSVNLSPAGAITGIASIQPVACVGQNSGNVAFPLVQGGSIAGVTYQYAFKDSIFQTLPAFGSVAAGSYSFWVKEVFPDTIRLTANITAPNGCKQQAGLNAIRNNGPLNVRINGGASALPLCPGGTLMLEASGAADYTWSPIIGLSNPTGAKTTANPATTTVYTVTGTSGSCTATAQVTVVVPSLSTILLPGDTAMCLGSSIALPSSGAQGYEWSGGPILAGASTCCPVVNPTKDTWYKVAATTTDGCIVYDSVFVRVYPFRAPEIILKSVMSTMSACVGDTIRLHLAIQGGSALHCDTDHMGVAPCSNPVTSKPVGIPTGIENSGFAFNSGV
jgi:hypothetical protein